MALSTRSLLPALLAGLISATTFTACWTEVIQTARNGPDSALGGQGPEDSTADDDPTEGTTTEEEESRIGCNNNDSLELPSDPTWGGEDEITTFPYPVGSYGASEGPGIFLAASAAYRLYVNGLLIQEGMGVGAVEFIPLSLLPGDNVIALVIASSFGQAAALIQIDELDQSYVSDGTFRVSRAPSPGWQQVDFDDSDWSPAEVLSDAPDVEDCDLADLPAGSSARWIGASEPAKTIALRRLMRIAPIGFGQTATGGGSSAPIVVNTFEGLDAAVEGDEPKTVVLGEGDYDFRLTGADAEQVETCPSQCPNDPAKQIYHVISADTVCSEPLVELSRNDRRLTLGSNTTLIGLGRGASLRGVGLDFDDNENIIVRNVAVYDLNPSLLEAGDAFGLESPKRVWVDHGTVKWASDGFTDIREGAEGITLSFMHYDGSNEATCLGFHEWTSEITEAQVTIHHSRYDHIKTRGPFVTGSTARVHLFNNVYSNVLDWAVGARCQAEILMEGNTFENVEGATLISSCDTGDLARISMPEGSNLYREGGGLHLGGDGAEPRDAVFGPSYQYELELANQAWPRVISRAGTGGPWALPLLRD